MRRGMDSLSLVIMIRDVLGAFLVLIGLVQQLQEPSSDLPWDHCVLMNMHSGMPRNKQNN